MNNTKQSLGVKFPTVLLICATLFCYSLNQVHSHEATYDDPSLKTACDPKHSTLALKDEEHKSPSLCLSQIEEVSEEETYDLDLSYYFYPSKIHYKDIGFVGVCVSNGQMFLSEWRAGALLPFKKYGTDEVGRLHVTKSMFPLRLSVTVINSIQPLSIIRDMVNNNFKNTSFDCLKKWGEESPFTFTLKKTHLFDNAGKLGVNSLCIGSIEPTSGLIVPLKE